ncbi:MAG: hypothetical protein K2X94_00935 [Amoebophilaceae bacterium]|nr:hypothetical protein [Amoebophilaceae bacterium]
MALWYTINGLSGTPRQEMVDFVLAYFLDKKKVAVATADPKGTDYGKLANDIIVTHRTKVSAFTEALLYLTCSKEVFDHTDWATHDVVVSRGSFLETFGYQNQLSDWKVEDIEPIIKLFSTHIDGQKPKLSIVLTEDYETAAKRAGDHFEYIGKKIKYDQDSKRFLQIKENPVLQAWGIKIANIEVNGRDPWKVFEEAIKPLLEG